MAASNHSDRSQQLGPMIRLWGLQMNQLPKFEATPDQLTPFLFSLLHEAVPFIDTVAPKNSPESSSRAPGDLVPPNALWKSKGTRSAVRDSWAPVALLKRVISPAELESLRPRGGRIQEEPWVCRASLHADDAAPRTASWQEFYASFKEAHPETEEAFTPGVTGARVARQWDCGTVEIDEGGEIWGRFTLELVEMRHHIGPIFSDRVFPVIQMTCAAMEPNPSSAATTTADAAAVRRTERPEFLVVSVTVNDFPSSADAELSKDRGIVVGAYASVERLRKLAPGPDGVIEWLMATASDARGVIPMKAQEPAVPGAIAKDVFLFLRWMARQRRPPRRVGTAGQGNDDGADGVNGVNGNPNFDEERVY